MKYYGEYSYTIRAYEVNPKGITRLASLCDLLQESASRHANDLKFGYEDMIARERFWVLVRMSVRVIRYPAYGEVVVVRTWPKGISGPFALRDFTICDANGDELLLGTSGWLVLNSATRKPVRSSEILEMFHDFPTEHAIEEPPVKVGRSDTFDLHGDIVTRPSDVDLQNHVNSMRYVSWLEDAYAISTADGDQLNDEVWSNEQSIFGLDINFVKETKAGEKLRWSLETVNGIRARNGETGSGMYAARIIRARDNDEIVRSQLHVRTG